MHGPSRLLGLCALPLLLIACGDDAAPTSEVPSWAKVAKEQIAEAEKHGGNRHGFSAIDVSG